MEKIQDQHYIIIDHNLLIYKHYVCLCQEILKTKTSLAINHNMAV